MLPVVVAGCLLAPLAGMLRADDPPAAPVATVSAPAAAPAAAAQATQDAGTATPPAPGAAAASPLVETPAFRIPLDGRWDMVLDPTGDGETRGLQRGSGPGWTSALRVAVPGPLEATTESAGYDGVAFYRTTLPAPPPLPPGQRLFLCFDSVNWRASVSLDAEPLGRHDGGDAPFRFDVTGRLRPTGSTLVVRCVDPGERPADGLLLASLPNAREAWFYNFGGIDGHVSLQAIPDLELRRHDAVVAADGEVTLRLDVENHGEAPASAAVTVEVDDGALAVTVPAELPPGATTLHVALPGAGALTHWSPAAPSRHDLRVTLARAADATGAGATGASVWRGKLALRRFVAAGGHFVLDGQPVAVHGVQYEPVFPRGVALPPDGEFLRRELSAIRAAGFNLVRVPSRVLPELLELCDELGLLVHAEPTMGTLTHESDATAPAVDAALVRLAEAVAGHPSVVLVSVVDELSGVLEAQRDALLARAHALLPEVLVMGLAGADATAGAARLINPSDAGDPSDSSDTGDSGDTGEAEPMPFDDVRLQDPWPWTEGALAALAGLGTAGGQPTGRLVYVSRWRCAGVPSFRDNFAGFGGRLASDDARDYGARLQAAMAQFAEGGPLSGIVPDVATLANLCQAAQARALRTIAGAIRGNPAIAGDCYASWRDVAWHDAAGLCNAWGNRKPPLAALVEANGRTGPATPAAAAPLPPRERLAVASGSLVGLTPELQAVLGPLVSQDPIQLQVLPRLAVVGPVVPLWTVDSMAITLSLLRYVREGGTLLLLQVPRVEGPVDPAQFGEDSLGQLASLPVDVAARRCRPGVQTWMLAAPGSPLLAGIPAAPAVLDERFAAVLPDCVLRAGPGCSARPQLACVDEHGEVLGAAVQELRYGAGSLLLSTLDLRAAERGDPLAVRLLENLVGWAAGIAAGRVRSHDLPADTPPPEQCGDIARAVWRHQMEFALAERLAEQDFLGRRPVRDEVPELKGLAGRKIAGLDAILTGRVADGLGMLSTVDRLPGQEQRDEFLQAELALIAALSGPSGGRDAIAGAGDRLEAQRLYQRALRLMRLGETAPALGDLRQAARIATGVDEPSTGR